MGEEENKATARMFYEEVVNRGNISVIDKVTAENYVDHTAAPGMPPGREGEKQWFLMLRAAFPDGHTTIDDDGAPIEENIQKYLEADLLDDYGFSEWVGPEPHGLGKHNMGTVKDPFTADETIDLLKRFDGEESDEPWLTVCSFLNPHDDS